MKTTIVTVGAVAAAAAIGGVAADPGSAWYRSLRKLTGNAQHSPPRHYVR